MVEKDLSSQSSQRSFGELLEGKNCFGKNWGDGCTLSSAIHGDTIYQGGEFRYKSKDLGVTLEWRGWVVGVLIRYSGVTRTPSDSKDSSSLKDPSIGPSVTQCFVHHQELHLEPVANVKINIILIKPRIK